MRGLNKRSRLRPGDKGGQGLSLERTLLRVGALKLWEIMSHLRSRY